MAMTKVEQAEMEALRTKLALRWSGMTPPERLPLPTDFGEYVLGWDFNAHRGSDQAVFAAWTKSNTHGIGHDPSSGGSQRGWRVFATRSEALIALRLATEEAFATALRDIDLLIENEP